MVWNEIISNILNKKVIAFKSPEIANLGAGILAMRGCELNNKNFGKKILEDKTVFEADKTKSEMYEEIYKKYIDIERLFV